MVNLEIMFDQSALIYEGKRQRTGYKPVVWNIWQRAVQAGKEVHDPKTLLLYRNPNTSIFELPHITDAEAFSVIVAAKAVIDDPVVAATKIVAKEPTVEEIATLLQGHAFYTAERIKPRASMLVDLCWNSGSVNRRGSTETDQYQKKLDDIRGSLEGIMGEPILDNVCGTAFSRVGCDVLYTPLVAGDIISVDGSNQQWIQAVIKAVDLPPTIIRLIWQKHKSNTWC